MQRAVITSLLMASLLGGCAFTQPPMEEADTTTTSPCRFIERNLTVKWADRSYWCIPQR